MKLVHYASHSNKNQRLDTYLERGPHKNIDYSREARKMYLRKLYSACKYLHCYTSIVVIEK